MGGSWLGRACRRLIDHEGRPKDRTSRQIHRFIHKKRSIRNIDRCVRDNRAEKAIHIQPIVSRDKELVRTSVTLRVHRIQENKPDVILLDLMMPEMDGFAVVAALQKETGWQDIPVIVITARDLDVKDRERLNSGVQSVLVKERFQPSDLVERVRRLVQTKPTIGNGMEAAS